MRQTLPWGGHQIYDRLVARKLQSFYTRLAARLEGSVIVDIGCGPGHLVSAAAQLHDAKVIGIDLDPKQIEIARRHYPKLDFRVGDSAKLPFEDDSLDMAITTESFHHWENQGEALDEIYRALAPGGNLWIVEGSGDMTRSEYNDWSGTRGNRLMHWIAQLVFSTHGYTTESLESMVIPVLRESAFGKFTVERWAGWWIIKLQKPV